MVSTPVLAEVTEVSTECVLSDKGWYEVCTTDLLVKDIPEIDNYKNNIGAYMTKKTAFRMGKTVEKDMNFTALTWDKDTLRVVGTIPVGTQNYWGILNIYNSTWWNSSWNASINFNISDTSGFLRYNEFVGYNFTGLDDKQGDNDDLRLINASDNVEIPIKIGKSGDDYAYVMWFTNVTALGQHGYYLYWDNENATDPSYSSDDWSHDEFDDGSLDGNIWGRYETTDGSFSRGEYGETYYVIETDASATPSYSVLYTLYDLGSTDTFNYFVRFNLTQGATYTAWSFLNMGYGSDISGGKTNGCGYRYNDGAVYCAVGDGSDNINQNNPNTVSLNTGSDESDGFPNCFEFLHLNTATNYVRFSNDSCQDETWTSWANITGIAGIVPIYSTIGKNGTSGGYGDASTYSYFIDFFRPVLTDVNFTINISGVLYEEPEEPEPEPEFSINGTIVSYTCIGNYSVRNTTYANATSDLIYTFCENGCDYDNQIIPFLDIDNKCNPKEWIQSLLVICFVIVIFVFVRRFL